MNRNTPTAALFAALITAAAGAHAAPSPANDAALIANAKVPMAQAIAAAEAHVGGKASKAEYERTRAGWAYDVEVVKGDKVFDVRIDATSGTVVSMNEDKADRDDDHDERD
ncbi:MAG: PepSY domain-containing protein [Burkholderiaceae bacterium]